MTHPPINDPLAPTPSSLHSTPLRPLLLSNLTTQTHLLQTFFTLLSSPNPTAPTAPTGPSPSGSTSIQTPTQSPNTIPSLYLSLVSSIYGLSDLVDEAYAHQDAYTRLMRLTGEVKALEGDVRARIRSLADGVGELEGLVKEGRKVRQGIERSEKDPLSSSTLLSSAQNLASHSSAPISSLLLPQDKAQYMPWPTEAAMRAGLLFMMGGSMSGVGDLGKMGDESTKMDVDTLPRGQEDHNNHHAQQTHEEEIRRYDPNAVFQLELNSDSDEDD